METTTQNSLPLILVSAYDLQSAAVLISELNDNKVEYEMEADERTSQRNVWRIVNKYYRVDVEMYPVADAELPPPALAERLEAHVIYIADHEEDDETASSRAEERWRRAAAAGAARAPVRLLLCAAARLPAALRAWARRRRYEPVALRRQAPAPAPGDDAPFPDAYGAERARAALHAHAWRGLVRLDRPARGAAPAPEPPGATSSDEDYEGADGEEGEEGDEAAVERAELFAEALGALGGARDERGLSSDERRRRAERLVAVFCRALGGDLPAL